MPDETPTYVVVRNTRTGGQERLPIEEVDAAVRAGTHEKTDQSVVRTRLGDTVLRSTPEEGAAHIEGGLAPVSGAGEAAEAFAGAQRDAYDTAADKALTFAEGVVDAATLGLIHQHGYEADRRRDNNSGYQFAGQVVGIALGMKLPGVGTVTKAGRSAGRAAAKAVLGETRAAGKIAARTAEEAGIGAALMGATSVGHQVSDAVFEDKPFVGEAVLHEAGLGTILGGAFGFVGGSLSKALGKASRGTVAAQGGLVDLASTESRALRQGVRDVVSSMDAAVERHGQRVGVLEVLGKEGKFPAEMLAERRAALSTAEKLRDKLGKLDLDAALSGTDDAAYRRWRDLRDQYEAAVSKLDDAMTPTLRERAARSPAPEGTAPRPQYGPMEETFQGAERALRDGGAPPKEAFALDRAMTPEARARYKEIYGRDFQDMDAAMREMGVPLDEPLPGGEVTPTSELESVVASPRARNKGKPAQSGSPLPEPEVPAAPVGGPENAERFARFRESRRGDASLPKLDLAGGSPVPVEPIRPGRSDGQKAIDRFIDDWHTETSRAGRPTSPADRVGGDMRAMVEKVRAQTGGRLDSAASVDLLKHLGLPPSSTTFGTQLDQVVALRKIAAAAADESRGVPSAALRKSNKGRILDWIGRRYAGHSGAKALTKVAGGSLGGPAGWLLGTGLYNKLFGFAGAAAGAAGRLNQSIVAAAEGLLAKNRATIVARSWRAVASNTPVAYSDAGPIQDPVKRVVELQRVAANPNALKAYLESQLGDLALLHPEVAQYVVDQGAMRVIQLSLKAPQIVWDRLGNPRPPGAQALRRFLEFENATHDLPGLLSSVQSGRATGPQLEALRLQHPAAYAKLVGAVFADPDALRALPIEKLKDVERVTNIPLTTTSDPMFLYRQQQAWTVHRQMAPNRPAPSSGGPTAPAQTPAQAGSRAPGN